MEALKASGFSKSRSAVPKSERDFAIWAQKGFGWTLEVAARAVHGAESSVKLQGSHQGLGEGVAKLVSRVVGLDSEGVWRLGRVVEGENEGG